MSVLLTVVGFLLVALGLQDVFHTLFHPAERGDISDWITREIWRLFRRSWTRALSFAGPFAFVAVISFWAASVTVGFALIFLPRLPQWFAFAEGLDPSSYNSFGGALNVSLGCLITLSTGIYSTNLLIQLLMGLESTIGFALLTAAVSWILSIYPALERRKSLAHEATLLHFAESKGSGDLDDASDAELQQIMLGLASQVITCRNELSQFPITYYFHEEEAETALAGILHYLSDIAEKNVRRRGAAGLGATTLGGAVDDYLKLVAQTFLRRPFTTRRNILRAFAADHMQKMVRSPWNLPRVA
jgi:hypothetical protein